jgi:hypothetical protein
VLETTKDNRDITLKNIELVTILIHRTPNWIGAHEVLENGDSLDIEHAVEFQTGENTVVLPQRFTG